MSDLPHKEDKSGRIQILERVGYKDGTILTRLYDEEIFTWDVVWHDQIYGSHFIVPLDKGKKKHDNAIIMEVGQMCYAGGATTIDMLRGEGELDPKTKQNVEIFEANRDKIDKPIKE